MFILLFVPHEMKIYNFMNSRHVSPALIQIEAQIIADATDKGLWDDGGEMSVRASANSRQASAHARTHRRHFVVSYDMI